LIEASRKWKEIEKWLYHPIKSPRKKSKNRYSG